MTYWTVGRRVGAGFTLGLGLVVVVAAVGETAVKNAVAAYEEAIEIDRQEEEAAQGLDAQAPLLLALVGGHRRTPAPRTR